MYESGLPALMLFRKHLKGEVVAGRSVTGIVRELLGGYLAENCYELWNVEWSKKGPDSNLIITVDKDGGINTDDCEKVSRYIERRLDEENIIDTAYQLIVSSPGMDRTLLTDEHFKRYKGTPVDVSLYKGVDGSKMYSGLLGERTDAYLTVTMENGASARLPVELISKVKLQVVI